MGSNESSMTENITKTAVFVPHSKHRRDQRQKMIVKKDRYVVWLNNLKSTKINRQHLLLPVGHVWNGEWFCSDEGQLQVQFDGSLVTLHHQIKERQITGKYFKQSQLWHLLFIMLQTQYQFAINEEQIIGGWHPSKIVVRSNGQIYIGNQLTYPKLQQESILQFLSPEQIPYIYLKLLEVQDQQFTNKINKIISQTFQIGLTLLSAANLFDYQQLYQTNQCLKLDLDRLQEELQSWRKSSHYTVIFTSLLINFCSWRPSHRLAGPQLWDWFKLHQSPIINQQPFTFDYIPAKINSYVALNINKSQRDLMKASFKKRQNSNLKESTHIDRLKQSKYRVPYFNNLYETLSQQETKATNNKK